MAECAGLENRCVRKGTEGSNPSLSADFCSVFQVAHAFSDAERFFRNLLVYTKKNPITPGCDVVAPTAVDPVSPPSTGATDCGTDLDDCQRCRKSRQNHSRSGPQNYSQSMRL